MKSPPQRLHREAEGLRVKIRNVASPTLAEASVLDVESKKQSRKKIPPRKAGETESKRRSRPN